MTLTHNISNRRLIIERIVSTIEHYDMLIDEGCDPFRDGEILKSYMSRWDGPLFYNSVNLSSEKMVLEVGVGTGRVAQNVLEIGCKHLTGIDISPKTIERAKENLLSKHSNVELLYRTLKATGKITILTWYIVFLPLCTLKTKKRLLLTLYTH